MSIRLALIATLSLCAFHTGTARADLLTISDGQSTFSYDPDVSGGAALTGASSGDVLSVLDWGFRYFDPLTNSVQSISLASVGNSSATGRYVHNESTSNGDTGTTIVSVDSTRESLPSSVVTELFDIQFDYGISTYADGIPVLTYTVTVTNVTDSTQSGLSLMNYADYDLNGFDGDSGILAEIDDAGTGVLQTDDATRLTVLHAFDDYDAYEIKPWTSGDNLIDDFLDGEDMANTGSPFGPGDMTVGFQWDFSLDAGESYTITGYAGGIAVPEPSVVGLTSLLVVAATTAGWVRRRRRRRA